MTEIEWLDADGRQLAAPPPGAAGPRRRDRLHDLRSPARWIEAGWLVTAALAVVAPFLRVYRLQIEHARAQEVDGWGRFDAALNMAEGSGAHGLRFGIVTCVAAASIAVALVLGRVRPDRTARLAFALRVLGLGLLAATTAAAFLDMDALIDSVRSQLARFESPTVTSSLQPEAGSWTMLAGSVVGLVTLLADAGWSRAPRGPTAPVERPLGVGDEAL